MDKKEIANDIKYLKKMVVGLIKKFEAGRKRLDKAATKTMKKSDSLHAKLDKAKTDAAREKINAEIGALPDYDRAIDAIGKTDDSYEDSVLGLLDQIRADVENLPGKVEEVFDEMPEE
jgi:uncharacterized protein HemX